MNDLIFRRFAGDFDNWTRWFDLHATEQIRERRPDAYRWYAQQTKPIYRWEPDAELPSCAVYPRTEVQRFFGDGSEERDFAGSLSWMLALAILDGFRAIDLFWFPLDGNEAGYQRQIPSVRYWIGHARGRGIRVVIHGDSALTPSGPLYGYET